MSGSKIAYAIALVLGIIGAIIAVLVGPGLRDAHFWVSAAIAAIALGLLL